MSTTRRSWKNDLNKQTPKQTLEDDSTSNKGNIPNLIPYLNWIPKVYLGGAMWPLN